jgi:hypothetical protein
MCLQSIIEWNGHGTQQGKVRDLLLCLFCNGFLWAVGNENNFVIFLIADVCYLFFFSADNRVAEQSIRPPKQ